VRLRARWVLPIVSPPIHDGWVDILDGRISGLGQGSGDDADGDERDLGHVALMPGLVNAHTHLELSYLEGAVPPASRFTDWIREVMASRRAQPDPLAPPIVDAARAAIAALHASGAAAVGDISNTLVTVPLLNDAPLAAAVFLEVLRFRASEAEAAFAAAVRRVDGVVPASHVRIWPAPHAPYSVSPRLFAAIGRWLSDDPIARTSVHLAESVQETELLQHGDGPFRDLLQDVGAWDAEWMPPGCGSVEYLERLHFLGPRTLAVHGVQMDTADLARLARSGATLVTCPRSNRHVGVGDPPIARFYESAVPVAIGTDSLASAPDLGVFAEVAAMRALAPALPASRLLDSATLVGARALGCAGRLGSIEIDKNAALIAVEVPPGVTDVEEYLVSGIDPAKIRWAASARTPPRDARWWN
jgi:cytosine/adenosine deaminase-related metal-dependent hydrolase